MIISLSELVLFGQRQYGTVIRITKLILGFFFSFLPLFFLRVCVYVCACEANMEDL